MYRRARPRRRELVDRRFGLDGAPTWDTTIVTDGFPYVLEIGPDGTLHLAFNPPGEPGQPTYEVRFSPDGAALSVETFDYGPAPGHVTTGALRCDGTLLLAGYIATPPTPDDQVVDRKDAWLTRHTMGGDLAEPVARLDRDRQVT